MEDAEILEPYELEFSDLMLLSSDKPLSSLSLPSEEIGRLKSVTTSVMENLGPTGPGLLAITRVPDASSLRQTLLPLARKLALLNNEDRNRVFKEHGLGSDVPLKNLDRTVSPFARQLMYVQDLETLGEASHLGASCPDVERLGKFQDSEFKNLGNTFKELGFRMMELGRSLARICDKTIGGQVLEQSLLESCTAKGRLIHYHSTLDNLILKEAAKRKGSAEGRANYKSFLNRSRDTEQTIRNQAANLRGHETNSSANQSTLWQQWHYDYGIFTVLTSPMFMLPCHPETTRANECSCVSCNSPSGHTYLQIFHPHKNSVLMVKASPESFIVQVGESADILSKGKLRSTLHSVCRPAKLGNLSRETFVVFLQPAWSKTLSLVNYPIEQLTSNDLHSGEWAQESHSAKQGLRKPTKEIQTIVPPLSARLKDGMTFAEFSRETTKQYYGGSGLQSKR